MNKKTLFSVYGYGLGHATRCHAIINELMKPKKTREVKVRIAATNNAYQYFRKLKMNPLRINSFQIGNTTTGFSWIQTLFENIDLPFNMIADYYNLKKEINEFKPDLIVSDSEPVSLYTASSLDMPCAFLSNLILTLGEYKHLPVGVKNNKVAGQHTMINAFIDQALKWCGKLLSPTIAEYKASRKIVFTDLITRAKPSELPEVKELRNKLKIKDKYYIVSFGGARIGKEYYKGLLPVLKKLNHKFIVSTNNAVRRYHKIKNLELYPFINNFLEYLKCAEGIICLAGHSTLSENIIFNKPSFVIPIRDHVEQLGNASVIERKGYGSVYYIDRLINSKRLLRKINEFIENKDYYENRINRSKFKGQGASECAKVLINM